MIIDTKHISRSIESYEVWSSKKCYHREPGRVRVLRWNIYTFNDEIAVRHWSPFNNVNSDVNAKALQSIFKDMKDNYVDIYYSDCTLHIDGESTSAAFQQVKRHIFENILVN